MTVSTTTYSVTALGNGATTAFTFSFIADSADTIQVYYTDINGIETLLDPVQYTLSINTPAAGTLWGIGGTVTYPISGSAITAGTSLTITRTVPYIQDVSISNQGAFYPQAVEQGLDLLELQIQQIEGPLVNAVRAPPQDGILDMTLPVLADRASEFLAFDSNGQPVTISLTGISAVASATSQEVFLSQSGSPITQATLTGADAAAVILGAILIIDADVTLSSNVVLSSRLVRFAGGIITRGTHTISGKFEGSMAKCFDTQTSTSGLVTFTAEPAFMSPQMWGAVGTGYPIDDYYPTQASLNCIAATGGCLIIRGTFYTTLQLIAVNPSGNLDYWIDGYGGFIIPEGSTSPYGFRVSGYSGNQGAVIRGLTVDQYNSHVTGSSGGFYLKGAENCKLVDCVVRTSSASLGAGRSSYCAYVVTNNAGVDSLWIRLENCSNVVPDDSSGLIQAGLFFDTANSNAPVVENCRFTACGQGMRFIYTHTTGPNAVTLLNNTIENCNSTAIYVLMTDNTNGLYPYGFIVNGLRYEPHASNTSVFTLQTTGAATWNNTTTPPNLSNLMFIDDGTGGLFSIPSNMTIHTDYHPNATATLSGGTIAVNFATGGFFLQPNTAYVISLGSDTTGETFKWVSKATTGFSITSSNGASTAKVDWAVTR